MKGKRVYIVTDGLVVYSGRDIARAIRLRDRHWPNARVWGCAPPDEIEVPNHLAVKGVIAAVAQDDPRAKEEKDAY